MKRILIIAEQYYPLMVPGAFRVASFARYLPQFGFEPILLVPNWNQSNAKFSEHGCDGAYIEGSDRESPCQTHRYKITEKKGSRIVHQFKSLFRPTFPRKHDAASAVKAANTLFKQTPFDAIIGSGQPHFVWCAAKTLSAECDVPWIADVRDVTDQVQGHDNNPVFIRIAKSLLNYRHRYFKQESRLLSSASLIVTVSDGLRDLLMDRGLRNVHVIMNGFDEEDYNVDPFAFEKFVVLHAGSVYPFHYPTVFLDAVDILVAERPDIAREMEIKFYGNGELVRSELVGRASSALTTIYGTIPKRDVVPLMMGAHVLLHFSTPGSKGYMTSKLTEYIAAGRPILTVPGDGDVVDQVLKHTGSGVSCGTAEQVKAFLVEQWDMWKRGTSSQYVTNPAAKGQYSRRTQCKELANLLTPVLCSSES